jgi:hypothetical protein
MPAPIWSLQPNGYSPEPGPIAGFNLMVSTRAERPLLTCGVGQKQAEAIRVIIPTRDCADMLDVMVQSLIEGAERPDLLRITIVDNRSRNVATDHLLKKYSDQRIAETLAYEAPFNWSRMNNIAAAQCDEPLLVFANNDMKMLSGKWDARVRGQLARPDVGVVGARLLYPDGTIQHAGMLMGFAEGAPIHDGVFPGMSDHQNKPRFDQVHAVAAVTGAFFAVRREAFLDLGGFDEARFAIAYNDVDYCLSVRAAGLKILYDPGIELVHYESRTRGLNDNRAKIAWDQGELRALYQKWGDAVLMDPWVSPLEQLPKFQNISPTDTQTICAHIVRAIVASHTPT